MDLSTKILSNLTVHMKYAKYLPKFNRRETWKEIVDRNKKMHIKKFPQLKSEIEEVYKFVYDRKLLPSMRSMQFAGKPIEISPNRVFNCAYCPIDDWRAFSEIMFLLLGGTGVGVSVQKHHVEYLPEIRKPSSDRTRRYLIGDSIEGWADAIKVLMKSYFGLATSTPVFDYSDIRAKGALLVTSGGKAPGPQPLKDCVYNIQKILDNKNDGDKLKPIEVHDIICHIADAVLAGGIRRAAIISLFSFDDAEMLSSKFGNWWESNPQRGRANNSVVILRHKIKEEEFFNLWHKIEESGSGEPGIYFSNDKDYGCNPSLRAGTKVLTEDGIFPIEELEGKDFVVPNLNGKWSEAKCWKSGKDIPLWKLTFDNGVEYYSSPQHEWPIFVNGRYIKCSSDKLMAGDLLPINNFNREKLYNGSKGDYDLGFTLGWLYGDGCLSQRKSTGNYVASFVVSKTEQEVLPKLLNRIKEIDGVERTVSERESTFEFQVGSKEFISLIMDEYGVNKKELGLPKQIWSEWSDKMIRGFIDGLFSSDGHVPLDSHGISLTSSKIKLVEDIQELLGFYGIKTVIHNKKVSGKVFPNGKDYNKTYESYVLRSTLSGRIKFSQLFNLSVNKKQSILKTEIKGNKNTIHQKFMVLKSVELTNLREDVWDISVKDDTHCFHLSNVTTGNCCEIGLRPFTFCNLVEVNVSDVETQDELNNRVKAAAFIGTLQASYTEFHYLREIWQRNTEKDSLIGVGMTGIASGKVLKMNLLQAAEVVKDENARVAELIGINIAARCTTIKPSGTSSLVLGTSSGIHGWHNDYYIRRMRVGKNESIYTHLLIHHPELIEDEFFRPHDQAVICIPQKAPDGSIFRYEKPLKLLERVKKFNVDWVRGGHRHGQNPNNVSVTVSIKKEYSKRDESGVKTVINNEWPIVGEWMWENRDTFNGISVLPYDGGSYIQAPFENCTPEKYDEMMKSLKDVDLTKVIEIEDNTDLRGETACSGGACEIDINMGDLKKA